MEQAHYVILETRGVLAVAGEDARSWLQGLISNDIRKVTNSQAIYAALLTPQGKFLHDFFIVQHENLFLLDCEASRIDELEARLARYRLRAQVTLAKWDWHCVALNGQAAALLGLDGEVGSCAAFFGGMVYRDPRLAEIGARAVLPREALPQALLNAGLEPSSYEDYDLLRLSLALPDGSRDIAVEKGFLLENNFDDLNGVDFDKGCYIGQELTARTKFRATVRKRLFRVDVSGPLPEPGTTISFADAPAGTMCSGRDRIGLALLRLDAVKNAAERGESLCAGEARLTPVKPSWANF